MTDVKQAAKEVHRAHAAAHSLAEALKKHMARRYRPLRNSEIEGIAKRIAYIEGHLAAARELLPDPYADAETLAQHLTKGQTR
jgi:hypothetical protein